jgi:hypothetical protein
MSQIKFSYSGQELVFTSHIVYPVSAPYSPPQAVVALADGGELVETVGQYPVKYFDLVFDHITAAEVASAFNWFESTVNWKAAVFTYHDHAGTQHQVTYDLPQAWDPKLVSYNVYSLNIRLKRAE